MELEKAKEILENEVSNICDEELSQALDKVFKTLENKDKEITNMREIFVKTAKHQKKLGHFELAEYMLAQIEATPTFTTWEEYTTWVSKEKIREIIKQLDVDIERNKRRKIGNRDDGSLSMTLIAYEPEIVKMRLLKLLEEDK